MMCIQLFVEENALGVLNVYSTQMAGAFTQVDDQYEGQALAAHVAVALAEAQEIEHLNHALLSRTKIAQAEGILMERFAISAPRAFEVLKRVSSQGWFESVTWPSGRVGRAAVFDGVEQTSSAPG